MVERTRKVMAEVPPEELAEARRQLIQAQAEYDSLTSAAAKWQNGTLDKHGLVESLQRGKSAAASLAQRAERANAVLSGLSAVAASIDPSEVYAVISASGAALATAVTISTSASSTAAIQGLSMGSDSARMVARLLAVRSLSSSSSSSEGTADAGLRWPTLPTLTARLQFGELSPFKRRWAVAAMNGAGGLIGFVVARRAKGVAATLSAVALGATTLTDGVRGLGGDDAALWLTGGVAEEEADLD